MVKGWRLEAGGWRLEAGGWRLEAGGWRLEAGGWRVCVNAPSGFFVQPSAPLSAFHLPKSCSALFKLPAASYPLVPFELFRGTGDHLPPVAGFLRQQAHGFQAGLEGCLVVLRRVLVRRAIGVLLYLGQQRLELVLIQGHVRSSPWWLLE